MTNKSKKPVKPVVKPFLKGSPTDERTWKSALGFFGALLATALMGFLVCSMLTMDSLVLRILLNLLVVALELMLFYNNAIGKGTDAVARGEILYQKQEKGSPFADSERALCFHPLKGYLNALLGTVPFLICAVALALTAHRQSTGFGTLPSWMSAYLTREEIGGALGAYTANPVLTAEDVLRLIVRVAIMPFVSMTGSENRDGLLLLERLSPLLVLLPACAYGTGYLQGQRERTRIHTGIAESNRRRIRKEKKARKARTAAPKGPTQLN